MSEFRVDIRKIDKIWTHDNADALQLASVNGLDYQFVVVSNRFRVGDLVLYFPTEAILPEPVIKTMGLEGRLSGGAKNRIKTVRLRGEISQGIVTHVHDIFPDASAVKDIETGELINISCESEYDFAPILGVNKYEPAEVGANLGGGSGRHVSLPREVRIYDLESIQRYSSLVGEHKDSVWLFMEKLEGTHIAVFYNLDSISKGVCSRRQQIIDNEQDTYHGKNEDGVNVYTEAAEKQLYDALDSVVTVLLEDTSFSHIKPLHTVILRGELIGQGIQCGEPAKCYGLKDHTVKLFEIEVDSKPISAKDFICMQQTVGLSVAPVITVSTISEFLEIYKIPVESFDDFVLEPFAEVPEASFQTHEEYVEINNKLRDGHADRMRVKYDGKRYAKALLQASNRPSVLNSTYPAEGIVMRLFENNTADRGKPLVLKVKSPDYLAKSKG